VYVYSKDNYIELEQENTLNCGMQENLYLCGYCSILKTAFSTPTYNNRNMKSALLKIASKKANTFPARVY
jgi:hypothetical protein